MNEGNVTQLEVVHVCRVCGTATERVTVNPESLINGLIACSHCHHEGHLNLEIRQTPGESPRAQEDSAK